MIPYETTLDLVCGTTFIDHQTGKHWEITEDIDSWDMFAAVCVETSESSFWSLHPFGGGNVFDDCCEIL